MTPSPHTALLKRRLLRDLLKQVSRLFYTTLVVVPRSVRDQVSLSYLFARAADTIADTDLIDRPQRLQFLRQFKGQFADDQVGWDGVHAIQTVLIPCQTNPAERVLLERLDDCFRLYLNLSSEDRVRVRRLMTTLTNGMEMDLTVFPATRDGTSQPSRRWPTSTNTPISLLAVWESSGPISCAGICRHSISGTSRTWRASGSGSARACN